jgi:holo-[acyl-carrier protein] synthase
LLEFSLPARAISIIATGQPGGQVIVGLGADIAEVKRLKSAMDRHGEAFLRRIYSAAERRYCEKFRNKEERFAGRFAAKEAAMKALGTGWRGGIRWADIEVVREKSGRPTLELHGGAKKAAEALGVKRISVTITHTKDVAFAEVIFEN